MLEDKQRKMAEEAGSGASPGMGDPQMCTLFVRSSTWLGVAVGFTAQSSAPI
jgi:hypothetical protein